MSAATQAAVTGTRLFARIKKSSKYFDQSEPGAIFPVTVDSGFAPDMIYVGGPGGRYGVKDVEIFAQVDEQLMVSLLNAKTERLPQVLS